MHSINNSKQIFIFTAGQSAARAHLNDSIISPIDLSKLDNPFLERTEEKDNLMTREELEHFVGNKNIFCWGSMPTEKNFNTWSRMNKGDYVICVYESRYRFISRLKTKLNSFDLAKYIWGSEGGKTWQYMYFLTEPIPIDFHLSEINIGDSYIKGFRGFSRISDERIDYIEDKYGSLDNFIKATFNVTIALDTLDISNDDLKSMESNDIDEYSSENIDEETDDNLNEDVNNQIYEDLNSKLSNKVDIKKYDLSSNKNNDQINIINEYALLPDLLKSMPNFNIKNSELFNPNINIKIEKLNLTIKTFNTLRRNGINFICELAQLNKEDLLMLSNFGIQSYNELIKSLLNYNDEIDTNITTTSTEDNLVKGEIRIEKLNLPFNIRNHLFRRGLNYISDFEKFTLKEIKHFKGFSREAFSSLNTAINLYEKKNSTKIIFKKDKSEEEKIILNNLWILIQSEFGHLKENIKESYISDIDLTLDKFFNTLHEFKESSYESFLEENSKLRRFENIYLLSNNEWKNLPDNIYKNNQFVYKIYKYILFKRFINCSSPNEAIIWVNNFIRKIQQPNNQSLKIYFQRIKGKTLSELGRECGVSRERIRQIESKANKLIGITPSEILNIQKELEEENFQRKEKSECEELIKRYGRLPCLADDIGEEEENVKKFLSYNLKERIEIYQRNQVEIPEIEFDFHYEFIARTKKAVGTGYWSDLKNLEKFILRHASYLGEPNLMPKQTSFPDSVRGVVTRFGGQSKVASLIGLRYQGQLVNPDGGRTYWTDKRLEELIDKVNEFHIQNLSRMPERPQFVNFFKSTSITKYRDKKVYSAFAALTKQDTLSWEEVANRFNRTIDY